jgi:hypothetical protein
MHLLYYQNHKRLLLQTVCLSPMFLCESSLFNQSLSVRVRLRFKYLSISDHRIGLVVGWLARTLDDEANYVKWLIQA